LTARAGRASFMKNGGAVRLTSVRIRARLVYSCRNRFQVLAEWQARLRIFPGNRFLSRLIPAWYAGFPSSPRRFPDRFLIPSTPSFLGSDLFEAGQASFLVRSPFRRKLRRKMSHSVCDCGIALVRRKTFLATLFLGFVERGGPEASSVKIALVRCT